MPGRPAPAVTDASALPPVPDRCKRSRTAEAPTGRVAAATNLIGCAVGASQKLRVPHRRAGDEVLGNLVIALRDLKQPMPHVFAVMGR